MHRIKRNWRQLHQLTNVPVHEEMVNSVIIVSYWLVFYLAILKMGVKKIGTEGDKQAARQTPR